MIVDKKKPDKFEIIGSLVAICGAVIIFLHSTLGKIDMLNRPAIHTILIKI